MNVDTNREVEQMSTRITEHIRSNVVGYIAIFMFAIGGTAYGLDGTNTVDSGDIINDQVRSADVRDDTLANGGLEVADLGPDSVGSSEVAPNAIGSGDVAPDSLVDENLAPNSVTTSEILDDGVQNSDLAPDSVGSSEVAPDSLAAVDLAPNSVGSSEVATESLGSADLGLSSVGSSELATGAIPSDGCCFGDGSTKLAPGSVHQSELQVDSVTSSELGTNSVGQDEIRLNSVGSSEVADGSLGTAEFASSIPAVRVTRTVGQGIPENSSTALTFNSERYDTANMHSTSSNTSRLTAPVTGIYEVSASIVWEIDTSGQRVLSLRKNGTTGLAFETDAPVGLGIAFQTISTVARLTAGEYVEARAQQISGDTLSIEKSNETSPEFSMTWLAPGP